MAFSAVSSVPYALAQRLGRFRLLSAAPIPGAILAAAVALPLAVTTGGVWPFLVRQAVAVIVSLLVPVPVPVNHRGELLVGPQALPFEGSPPVLGFRPKPTVRALVPDDSGASRQPLAPWDALGR